jgi:hypothetical protein
MSDDSIDPAELTVEDLRAAVGDCDDATELRRLKTAEIQGKDRKTAKEAVDDRLDALDSDGETNESDESDGTDDSEDSEDTDDADESDTDGAGDAEAVVGASDKSSSGEHPTKPDAAADRDTVVVRNPGKTTLQLRNLKGELAPGETKEYPVSDRLKQHIREGTLQVVTSR